MAIYILKLSNNILIYFWSLLCFSILLILTIFNSRSRVNPNVSDRGKKRLKHDIKFAISLITMNLFFLLLILPLMINAFLLPYYSDDLHFILYYIYFISFAVNFYVLFITNSLFRKVFFSLFFKIENSTHNQPYKQIAEIARNAETAF